MPRHPAPDPAPARGVRVLAVAALLALAGPAAGQVPVFEAPASVDPGAVRDQHADEAPRIAAGVGGVWVVAWQVVGASDLGLGRDVDVVWSRSSDDGAHWSAPRPMAAAFADDRVEDRAPAVATDGAGTWMVAWTSTSDLEGGSRRDRDIHFVVSTDNALTWSAPRALNRNAGSDWGDDDAVDLGVDRKGRWTAVWESSDSLGNTKGGDRDVLFATTTDAGVTWSFPEVVDASARTDSDFDSSPRVAADARGTWVVAWSSGGTSDERAGVRRGVVVSRSVDGTATWSSPQVVSGSGEDDRPDWGPRLAADGQGRWICTWSSSDDLGGTIDRDRDILFVRSVDDARTWSRLAPLNAEAARDSGDDEKPEVVIDGAGNWVAAWTTWDRRGAARGADADLLAAMSRDHGETWSRSILLNTNAASDRGEDTTPSLATDGAGRWIAAWASTETQGDVMARDRDVTYAVGVFGREAAGPPAP